MRTLRSYWSGKFGEADSAIVIKGDKILSKEPLRFEDEFVRHKILDIGGYPYSENHFMLILSRFGLSFLECRIDHQAQWIDEKWEQVDEKSDSAKGKSFVLPDETELMSGGFWMVPHRFPFVMIDKVASIEEVKIIGIKNVTSTNLYWSLGHPWCQGAAALSYGSAAGILLLRRGSAEGKKLASADKVKFCKPVVPGDQLIITAKLEKVRVINWQLPVLNVRLVSRSFPPQAWCFQSWMEKKFVKYGGEYTSSAMVDPTAELGENVVVEALRGGQKYYWRW